MDEEIIKNAIRLDPYLKNQVLHDHYFKNQKRTTVKNTLYTIINKYLKTQETNGVKKFLEEFIDEKKEEYPTKKQKIFEEEEKSIVENKKEENFKNIECYDRYKLKQKIREQVYKMMEPVSDGEQQVILFFVVNSNQKTIGIKYLKQFLPFWKEIIEEIFVVSGNKYKTFIDTNGWYIVRDKCIILKNFELGSDEFKIHSHILLRIVYKPIEGYKHYGNNTFRRSFPLYNVKQINNYIHSKYGFTSTYIPEFDDDINVVDGTNDIEGLIEYFCKQVGMTCEELLEDAYNPTYIKNPNFLKFDEQENKIRTYRKMFVKQKDIDKPLDYKK
jgi:hypothetical protein